MNSGIKSLVLTARQHGVDLSLERLEQKYALDENEPGLRQLLSIANENQLKARSVRLSWADAKELGKAFPVIALLKNQHYAIFVNIGGGQNGEAEYVSVLDPLITNPKVEKLEKDRALALWDGEVILLKRHFGLLDEDQPFSIRWIAAELFRQKALLVQIFLIALVMHSFGFLPIIYTMTVLDKVVNFKATETLTAITIGVALGQLFNGVFGYLKKYITLFVTGRLEAKLSSRAFQAALDLPLNFFSQQDRSVVIKSVQQVESIRQFISVKLFDTILDASSLLIFVPIMVLYSPVLFAVVFVFALLIAGNNIFSSRQQKEAVRRVGTIEARRQALLTASVGGIETVKSLTLEDRQCDQWDEFSSQSIQASMDLGKLSARSSQVSATLQQLMTVVLIFVGVLLVFDGSLSAGVLIGANMLAGKITNPLVQLVTLATDFKMLEMSVTSLGAVLNARRESIYQGVCPAIRGGVVFKDVHFAYKEGDPILDGLSFELQPRQTVALVGPSGCGKTTVSRLLLGLLRPQAGTVLIDDVEIRTVDLVHLRMNVSYIESNNTFFNESIRDNITKAMLNAPQERVLWASKLAGLHREVEAMPDGYETLVAPGGSNLSSGQRQKLALARALLRNPRVLILDEAISNLGIDDMIEFRKNLDEIRSGRTLIMITHDLSQVVGADQIVVFHKGKAVESGKHAELLTRKGAYAEMWKKQQILHGSEAQASKPA